MENFPIAYQENDSRLVLWIEELTCVNVSPQTPSIKILNITTHFPSKKSMQERGNKNIEQKNSSPRR